MLRVSVSGSFDKTETSLKNLSRRNYRAILERYGKMGVDALSLATPTDTGRTAASWMYKIQERRSGMELVWYNTNQPDGIPVAVLIQYGHGTNHGGWVEGRDYINPAIQPIFDQLSAELRR